MSKKVQDDNLECRVSDGEPSTLYSPQLAVSPSGLLFRYSQKCLCEVDFKWNSHSDECLVMAGILSLPAKWN